ncbi:MAG TPA: hypothetical protein VNY29_12130 [Terriglobales bacterium]|jgi:hypothetical protein|nr:hypothetical protein [Terriglobales bacterium]
MSKEEAWQFILQFFKSKLADDEAELTRLEVTRQAPDWLRKSIEQRKAKLREFEEQEKDRRP